MLTAAVRSGPARPGPRGPRRCPRLVARPTRRAERKAMLMRNVRASEGDSVGGLSSILRRLEQRAMERPTSIGRAMTVRTRGSHANESRRTSRNGERLNSPAWLVAISLPVAIDSCISFASSVVFYCVMALCGYVNMHV